MKLDRPHTIYKMDPKWVKDLNVRAKSIKTLFKKSQNYTMIPENTITNRKDR